MKLAIAIITILFCFPIHKSFAQEKLLHNDFLQKENYQIFGRLQYDATMVEGDNNYNLSDNFRFRRARIGVKGNINEGFSYKSEVEFSEGRAEFTDLFIAKSFDNNSSIKFGNFREPFSLEYSTSSNYLTFLERSLIDPNPTDRKIGIGYDKKFTNLNFYSGVFAKKINDDLKIRDSENSVSTRLVYYKENSAKDLIHFGGSYRISHPQDNKISLNFLPEARLIPEDFSIYEEEIDAKKINQLQLEAAATYNRFSMQAEYLFGRIKRNDNNERFLRGYYIQLSSFLTNDKKAYNQDRSTFTILKPRSKKGALEIAYRFSNTNMNNANVNANSLISNSFALNYYINNHAKLMTNYVTIPKYDIDIFGVRAQINF